MSTNLLWGAGIAVEIVVLFRGVYTALIRKYPWFYAYIGCILSTEILRFYCYQFAPSYYRTFFWNTELLTVAASYGVLIDVFRASLKGHAGMARLVQKSLLIVFVAAASYAATDLLHGGLASLPRAVAELGRDLRYIEGIVLLLMLWFFGRYRIAFGRNLLGILCGYSLWVGINVVGLALMFSDGKGFSLGMRNLFLPFTFLTSLLIWAVMLWSARPEQVRPASNELDHEYEFLAAKTRLLLARTSTRLLRTIRP
jgi:hypothetical protein